MSINIYRRWGQRGMSCYRRVKSCGNKDVAVNMIWDGAVVDPLTSHGLCSRARENSADRRCLTVRKE